MKDEIMTVERRGPNPEAVWALLEAILDWLVRQGRAEEIRPTPTAPPPTPPQIVNRIWRGETMEAAQ